MQQPPPLLELSLCCILDHVSKISFKFLDALPDHLLLELFEGVLARGKLNERLLDQFQAVARKSEVLAQRIEELNLQPLPPLPGALGRPWLGDKPSLF